MGVWSEDAECCGCENALCVVVCLSGAFPAAGKVQN